MASVKFRYLLRQESRTGARSYMPLMHKPALDGGVGDSELVPPLGDQRDAAEVTAGGMAADIDALGIAAEAFGILVDPGDGAADLRHQHAEVAASGLHPDEVERDVMRPGIDEHLRRKTGILRRAPAPRAAMHVNEDRRARLAGAIDIELFDIGRTIGHAPRRADARPRGLADAGEALGDLSDERLIGHLIV